ncbi:MULTISPECIES: protoporphyrinogen oxidase [Paenibacillus]|uniref:protoporphyrinogen oxidase n=1 Tax=Paenibacillus TaxID=44249 RepID=UPI002FE0A7F9
MKTVVIIGGGITGLSAAYYLQKEIRSRRLETRITLIESSERLGGKIHTVRQDGFIMEAGADSIVARKKNVAPLVEELGLSEEVVYNATGKSYIYTEGRLKLIPEDAVFGIPLSLESLAKSELISAEGKVEALKDFYTPNGTFTVNDSVGGFLEAFLGKEIVEKQIAPVLSGVYSGNLSDLTLASTLPYLLDYKNEYGSIIKGLAENRQTFKGTGDKKFFSFQDGVSALVDRIESRLEDVELLKEISAEALSRTGGRYQVQLSDGSKKEADFVVIATPHTAAQALLKDAMLDEDFAGMRSSSMISVYLGFDLSDGELKADGTGFIVSQSPDVVCDACTWTSRKWKHTSGTSRLLVRLFYKSSGPSFAWLQGLSENELLDVALKDVAASLGIHSEPVTHVVTKWLDSMPNYHIRHHELVQSLEQKLSSAYPGVYLAGCSYYGVGIPDCIANGEQIAGKIAGRMAEQAAI